MDTGALPSKAYARNSDTEFGITVFAQPKTRALVADSTIALQLPRESYLALSGSTAMDVRPPQLPKALNPIEATEAGMLTSANLVNP